jgi:N-acetylglutamate synthase-like GNAT family acetyltransferase
MKIRKAKSSEIPLIKEFIDSYEEMDVISETFSKEYYLRIINKGILLVCFNDKELIGVCFGNYNKKEKWADLLGLVVKTNWRKKGIGSSLINEFEKIVKENKLVTIDLYADKKQIKLFNELGYTKGRTYTSFRKKFNQKQNNSKLNN